ncbi:ADP-ribosylation [Lentithecium fluviatile CBS 122367]|uniref:ADP-ribosylation n=1 Tax=Lentithecium fluviatile CBS 122367 TaxID=1168545 RepID=A0A6G1IC18_9PLEO|nr:ADP-ribosylation [Lentithecium fluviatile CBS 122367]
MFGHSRIVYFAAFLALLAPALADVYRMDFRSPAEIQDDEGFVARDPDGDGSVIEHVKNKLGDDDPWISTTTDYSVAKGGALSPSEVYVYYISENGIKFVDTIQAFKDAGEEHPSPGEKEWSVRGKIDWDSIIKWDVIKRGKVIKTVTRDDFEDGEEDDDKKRSVPLVRSVKFRA